MRLINREKALEIAESYGTSHGTTLGGHSGVADIIHYELAKLSTIEAEPVRHGKWNFCGYNVVECSCCGEVYFTNMLPRDYCPNYGAKTDGGENYG